MRREKKLDYIRRYLRHWDPYGVIDDTESDDDEYDSLAPGILKMLDQGCDLYKLIAHLENMATGVGAKDTDHQRTAEQILKWYVRTKNRN